MTAIEEISAERRRQIEVEGWSAEHDDQHEDGSLAAAAACYAFHSTLDEADRWRIEEGGTHAGWNSYLDLMWPRSWAWQWWKPKDKRRDLIRAGALIVAEIERIDRASAAKKAA